jgi:hypothetical protein
MASTYKRINSDDIAVTRTPLYEAIPVTGTLVSSSVYGTSNIKTYTHGMFQTVYDYPFQSSSANALFDITVGRTAVADEAYSSVIQTAKKNNIYNQMAQVLVGYDIDNKIKKFAPKESFETTDTTDPAYYYNNCYFLTFSRLLVKDEIKKGTFQLRLGAAEDFSAPFTEVITIDDSAAASSYYTDSPTGDYGVLKMTVGSQNAASNNEVGYIFYQAGVVVLNASIFAASGSIDETEIENLADNQKGQLAIATAMTGTNGTSLVTGNIADMFLSASIDGVSDAFRKRVQNISFNNTTELNSTIYFCRVNHNEFNYSSNPTYLSSSQIVVKNTQNDAPISYITTVGLYSVDNELLAVAKLSEPIKKTPDDSLILRVRLDV